MLRILIALILGSAGFFLHEEIFARPELLEASFGLFLLWVLISTILLLGSALSICWLVFDTMFSK